MDDTAAGFADRVFNAALGYFDIASMYLGLRLGLYRTLSETPSLMAAELAANAGIAVSSVSSMYTAERDLCHPDRAKRREAVGQLSSLASFLREGPFSTSRCALWRSRSQIASASVASPMCSCHWAGGSWLVTIVEQVP